MQGKIPVSSRDSLCNYCRSKPEDLLHTYETLGFASVTQELPYIVRIFFDAEFSTGEYRALPMIRLQHRPSSAASLTPSEANKIYRTTDLGHKYDLRVLPQ